MSKENEILKLLAMIQTLQPYEVIEIKLESDKHGRLCITKKHTQREFIEFSTFA